MEVVPENIRPLNHLAKEYMPDTSDYCQGLIETIVTIVHAKALIIVINGGFARAYQKKTGSAGYTFVLNSYGLLLATHQCNEIDPYADTPIHDIECTTEIIENQQYRICVKVTDVGREIKACIIELQRCMMPGRRAQLSRINLTCF